MNIHEFVSDYENHPILFIGTGISLRYLTNSYTWDGLLQMIASELTGNTEFYLDLKSRCQEENGKYRYDKIAELLEAEFNDVVANDRDGKFKRINDIFYSNMTHGINFSRFKIYIAEIFSTLDIKQDKKNEIAELVKIRKNIGSIVTTNYDKFVENIFEFNPLIGNDILLSNPYGALYKIHGCVTDPAKIIITENDYKIFDQKYELIRAQLLSLFIHNPIIFMGYNIGDDNIKSILKTIFTYIQPNSSQAQKIRKNFLLVEYEEGSDNIDIVDHDIDMEGFSTIRINKIKTDNYVEIYQALSTLQLPISAMDIRKVQNVVKEIYAGGKIKVTVTEDMDALDNADKILVLGSVRTISYQYQTSSELMTNYFKIMDESNIQILTLIDKYKIQCQQYFPIFGFASINNTIESITRLKNQQIKKLKSLRKDISESWRLRYESISEIDDSQEIPVSYKVDVIIWSVFEGAITNDLFEEYLRNYEDKASTAYRKLLCLYDCKKYGDIGEVINMDNINGI